MHQLYPVYFGKCNRKIRKKLKFLFEKWVRSSLKAQWVSKNTANLLNILGKLSFAKVHFLKYQSINLIKPGYLFPPPSPSSLFQPHSITSHILNKFPCRENILLYPLENYPNPHTSYIYTITDRHSDDTHLHKHQEKYI